MKQGRPLRTYSALFLAVMSLHLISCRTITFVSMEGHVEADFGMRPDSLSLITLSAFGWGSMNTIISHYDSCVQMFSGDPVTMADSLHNEWASDTYLIRVEGPFGIPINLDGTFRYEDKFQYLPIHPIDRHSPVVYFIGHDPTVTVELDTIECDLYE